MGILDFFKKRPESASVEAPPSTPPLEPIDVLKRRLLVAGEAVAIQASEALARRGAAGVNALGSALAEIENKVVAEAASRALIARGPAIAIPFLVLGVQDGRYEIAECYEKALKAIGPVKVSEGAIDWNAVREVVATISNKIVTSPDEFAQRLFCFKSLTLEFCSAIDKNCVVWRYPMSDGKDLDCKRAVTLLDSYLRTIGLKAKVAKIRRDDLDGDLVQCIFEILEVSAWRAQVEAERIEVRQRHEKWRQEREAEEQSKAERNAEQEARVRQWITLKDYGALKANWDIARAMLLQDLRSHTSYLAISAAEFLIRRGNERDIPELAHVVDVQYWFPRPRLSDITGVRSSWDIQMRNMEIQKENMEREMLELNGTKRVAELLLNCGHQGLAAAAKTWANMHGYTIRQESGPGYVRWGSM